MESAVIYALIWIFVYVRSLCAFMVFNRLIFLCFTLSDYVCTEVCGKCGEALSRSQPAVRAMDKLFHSHCFGCMTCQRPLQGMQFYDRDGAPECEECYVVSQYTHTAVLKEQDIFKYWILTKHVKRGWSHWHKHITVACCTEKASFRSKRLCTHPVLCLHNTEYIHLYINQL